MAQRLCSNGLRKLAGGFVVAGGFAVGGGYLYRQRLRQNQAISALDFNAAQDQAKTKASLDWIRRAAAAKNGFADLPEVKVELFQYTTCPYCGKVKAFLEYYGIPHTSVEVEPMFKGQLSGSKYKKVPQLRLGGSEGTLIVDSDLIVEALAPSVGVESQLNDPEVQRLRAWARELLVKLVVLSINETLVAAWRGYDYIDAFDTIPMANKIFLKVVGAPVMYLVAKYKTQPDLLKSGHLKEDDHVRMVLIRELDGFLTQAALSEKKPFHGGATPDLADIEIYGVLQSVRGHAVYDALIASSRGVEAWLARMDNATNKQPYAAGVTNRLLSRQDSF